MATLSEIMLSAANRPRVIKDSATLLDEEVANKSGLSGLAVKGAYAVFKKVKPGIVEEALEGLIDDFVRRLEPVHTEYVQAGQAVPLEQYLQKNSQRIANTLLGVTDERATRAKNMVVKGAYEKLRPTAVKHIEEAMPGVARLLKKYL